ncbi:MAG: DUF1385 domain-containing protein [Actinomycetota bacterium]
MASDEGHRPHYYGGQAVIEGVMMRGREAWAVAVRRPSGEIYLERHPVRDAASQHRLLRAPFVRGTFALVDALKIGAKALTISANESVEEEEQLSGKEMGSSLLVALVLFIGVFIILPNFGLAFLSDRLGDGTLYHFTEGVLRIVLFLAYLGAISLLSDIRRVFAYHGAEHQTIAAYEHGEPLQPDRVAAYPTLHVRCGTNFLIMLMLLAVVVYSVAGAIVPVPDGGVVVTTTYHVLLRIVLLPVIAGIAYEGLRLGAGRSNLLVRAVMQPGLWLQKVTTKPSEPAMREVAIRAFQAVLPAAEHAEVPAPTDEAELASPLVWGPDEAAGDVVYTLSPVGDHPAPGGDEPAAHDEPRGGT